MKQMMMNTFSIPCASGIIILLCLSSAVNFSEGVKCYQCVYIEGVENRDMNPNCVSNVSGVHVEDGAACVTAEGEIGGKAFVVRRAFLPGVSLDDFPIKFPSDQESLQCDDERVINFGIATVTSVSDRRVDKLTSCTLCNDHDHCNEATPNFGGVGMHIVLTMVGVVILHYVY